MTFLRFPQRGTTLKLFLDDVPKNGAAIAKRISKNILEDDNMVCDERKATAIQGDYSIVLQCDMEDEVERKRRQ